MAPSWTLPLTYTVPHSTTSGQHRGMATVRGRVARGAHRGRIARGAPRGRIARGNRRGRLAVRCSRQQENHTFILRWPPIVLCFYVKYFCSATRSVKRVKNKWSYEKINQLYGAGAGVVEIILWSRNIGSVWYVVLIKKCFSPFYLYLTD